ncbi:MAG TPA: FAD/NAD(P)-binding protein [Brevundimonas sp.]|nr:FAD/NAD(P)-binding protein [Brevundimonas sp.]
MTREESAPAARVMIVGGGFSGAMLAARLAETGLASTVIDRSGRFGVGVAYSSRFEGHLLNVRAERMGAVDGRPDGFFKWLSTHHPARADPDAFLPRRLYGDYLRDRLAAVERAAPGCIDWIAGDAVELTRDAVRLADGRSLPARIIVLATGNPAPRMAGQDRSGRLITDPWATDALEQIGPDDDLVILGSGLTMADTAVWLDSHGWRGRATVISRRGLRPRSHAAGHPIPAPPPTDLRSGRLSRRLAAFRRLSGASDWQAVMEGLRPVTADLWRDADIQTRARFLRHLRPWWDVHRHRIAPSVGEVLTRMEQAGRLSILAGRIEDVAATSGGVTVAWRPAGSADRREVTAARAIDCTGPGHAPLDAPLTASLVAGGRARLEPLGLGLDLDQDGRAIRADGSPDPALFVLGPPAYAAFWETTAVPDIRGRIERLTAVLNGQISASR